MGGVFGKNKRPCVFPRVVYRARRSARVCCDAATWTGDTHFYSARVGRAPRGSQPPAATLVLETSGGESRGEEGDSASPPRAQHSKTSVPADTRGAELPQEPEAKAHPELQKRQELTGEAGAPQNPQDSREAEAVLHPPGSSLSPELCCGDQGVTPLTQVTVEVDVHVSAGDHGEPGQGQAAAKPELLRGTGQEAGAAGGAEDACVGKALWEVPVQEAGDTMAASCPLEAAEPEESITDGQGAAQEHWGEETEAPPDLQRGQGESPAAEGVEGAAGGPEQAEEMAETCGEGQTSEETPACLPETQEEKKTKVSSDGKAEEH
ncbi:PREDICTED: sarcalumenin-like [Ficedula albicollis]|uniref:sarcalumenin-like n=1 Tax=Ficedula albicollis TaxID=59894 RepID=UPI0003594B46|nr:PREDICTED: sarcalumenin-like [Ficedula albicollis]